MAKEGYKPTAGMQSAARRAIKLKEQGKAKGAGTAVGWTRAGQLARGETLSLSTVKRMYSFFSRHEVDKKGKDWNNSENPSNGKIMWLAWGGDAGFSWSRKIVEREKNKKMNKSIDSNEFAEEVKDILDDVVNPIDTIIEIEDDEDIKKAIRAEVTKEQLGMVVEHLMEAIESMIEMPEDGQKDSESEAHEMPGMPGMSDMEDKMQGQTDLDIERELGIYKSDNEDEDKWDNSMQKCWTGYKQEGMKDKGGRMVPNCVPVEKSHDMEMEEEVKKSLWDGSFDPLDIVKRKFSAESRRRMAESGNAMPDGSFPIGNKKDLMNAIRSWGRGGSDPKVKAHIKRRAKEIGAEDMIPENWK